MTSGQSKDRATHKGASNPLFELARTQLREGKFADAEATGRRLVTAVPKSAEAHILLADAQRQRGKPHDAVSTFRNALAIEPGNAMAHYLLGCALRDAKRAAEAEFAFKDAIAASPGLVDAHLELGNLFLHQRQFAEAESAYRNAIAARPTYAIGHFNLGNVLRETNRPEQAAAAYRDALKHKPDYADAWHNLGLVEYRANQPEAAVAAYRKAIELRRSDADVHNNLGMALRALGRTDEAMAAFREAIGIAPGHHLALCNLGNVLWDSGELDEAVDAYQSCIAAAPHYIYPYVNSANVRRQQNKLKEAGERALRAIHVDDAHSGAHSALGYVRYTENDFENAIVAFKRAMELAPKDPVKSNDLGLAYRDNGQLDEAIAMFRQALALEPRYPGALNNLGLALQEVGDLEGAKLAFRKAIEYAPKFGPAHGNLAHLVKFRERDDHMLAMEALLTEPEISPEHRASVLFGLAKAYDDLKDYAKSFELLHEANRLKRSLLDIDLTVDFELGRKMIETLDGAFFDAAEPAGDPSTAPIFIVGMARSGTSLVEQILASHSQVHGAGELTYLQRMFGDWMLKLRNGSYPRRASGISGEELRRLGAQYVAKLRRHSATAPFITDKMPFNFRFVGFLRLILPNARIVHCMRDPLDICISSYKRLFSNGVFYSYDLRELGLFYNSYRSLMAHWRTALPGSMFEIQYEDLVANQEDRTRELLAHCGLPWEDSCLNFHENERAVRTASLAQVRQPIYKTSVASSRKYFPYIGPLLETLGADADADKA